MFCQWSSFRLYWTTKILILHLVANLHAVIDQFLTFQTIAEYMEQLTYDE